ncbi:hypothetical protein BgiBS90_020269, partial [Biomphalaria glabrata]
LHWVTGFYVNELTLTQKSFLKGIDLLLAKFSHVHVQKWPTYCSDTIHSSFVHLIPIRMVRFGTTENYSELAFDSRSPLGELWG